MDKSILDYTRQSAALEAMRQSFIDGDPGALLCVEFYADRAEDLPPRLQALEADLRAHGFGYHYHHAIDLAAQARIWSLREAGLGLSMAMKDDAKSLSFVEDTAVPPERLRDYIERFLGIGARARHDGRRLRPRLGGLPARAAGGQPEDRRRACGSSRPSPTTSPTSCSSSAARCRASTATAWCAARSCARCSGPRIYDAFRDDQAHVRSGRHLQSRQDRRRRPHHRQPALRRRLRDAAARHVLRLLRVRRHGRRGRDVQRRRRLPQDARGHDVPVVHGHARGAALDARPRQRAAAGDGRPARRGRSRRRRRLRDARPVPRVPRLQGRVPGRRRRGALQERVPGRLLAAPRHGAARAGARQRANAWRALGSRFAPLSNWIAGHARRPARSTKPCSASTAGAACRSSRGRR